MTEFVTLMRANLAEIDRLQRHVDETFASRDRSVAERQAWTDACRHFHARFDQLAFPGGASQWAAFLAGKSRGIDAAIAFLDVDPWFFRSGYTKETIWHRLKRVPLDASRAAALETIALAWLRRRVRREFWCMAACLRPRASASFWDSVAAFATPRHGSTGLRAHWLLLTRPGAPVRRWVNAELLRSRCEPGYVPDLWFGPQGPDEAWMLGGRRAR
ncbi:hypothetical protein [Tahibacter caeni]|uniref:hypothetical protein n=1 Tax=Tahibacter caeni TaxID=1453545 RepID=UPI0021490D08|nr:hypothetical protein [Tahibacter caeni]